MKSWRHFGLAALVLVLAWSANSHFCAGDTPAPVTASGPCPVEFTQFVAEPAAPVFTAGPAGAWDARIGERGWILKENDQWHLWYTGYTGERTAIKKLGYASSRDGKTWTRSADNPLD